MFKLLNFSLRKHSILKDINIDFVEEKEIYIHDAPYTSVMIGVNGVGKSQILRAVAEIFRELDAFKNSDANWKRGFHFRIKYLLNNSVYLVQTSSFLIHNKLGSSREILIYQNIPFDFDDLTEAKQTEYLIAANKIPLPNKILVSSIMLNDRFAFADSKPEDFYQYLGIRRSSSQTSTRTFSKKTIRYLFDAAKTDEYKKGLSDLLDFMGMERSLKISYSLKYKPVFEKNEPDIVSFHLFFNEWWKVQGVRRSEAREPWGKWYYNKIKDDPVKIEKILRLINRINKKLTDKIHSKRSKEYIINVFSEEQDFDDFGLIEELVYLDILQLNGIQIKKISDPEYGVEQSSSGEYHLLLSLLGVFSRIEQNSLVFIDEPEISLHPNWQMRYIHELKKMFYKYASCHFIFATHSHFIVSDLEGLSSSVIALSRNEENAIISELLESDTFGWSAEQVLLDVFDVPTTRNYFIAERLAKIFKKASRSKNPNLDEYKDQLLDWHKRLNDNDPLHYTIEQLIKRLGWLN